LICLMTRRGGLAMNRWTQLTLTRRGLPFTSSNINVVHPDFTKIRANGHRRADRLRRASTRNPEPCRDSHSEEADNPGPRRRGGERQNRLLNG